MAKVEAVKAWGVKSKDGRLYARSGDTVPDAPCPTTDKAIRVRILREGTYRRLLAAAKRKGRG